MTSLIGIILVLVCHHAIVVKRQIIQWAIIDFHWANFISEVLNASLYDFEDSDESSGEPLHKNVSHFLASTEAR
jgi:hypothetical protein